jgi:ubiquitin C-terminal hydrolase
MEIMDGDNAWLNEKTNRKEPVYKRMTFWNLPSILIITLKRFSPDGRLRLNHTIDFPLENLNLEKYVSGYNPSKYVYDCYAICNHSGYVMGGHYTAFVKNASNQWIHYNDSNINIIEDTTQLITPMAYCLFYRKKNNLI